MLKQLLPVFILSMIITISSGDYLRIIGGQEIDIKEAKYHLAILYKQNFYLCGGVLITYVKALTAAHCFFQKDESNSILEFKTDDLSIFGGNSNISGMDSNTFESSIRSSILHPLYKHDSGTNQHDIAILMLENRVPHNHPTIAPVLLRWTTVNVGTKCIVTGWGKTSFKNVPISQDLLAAQITIQDMKICNESYKGKIKTGMICCGSWKGGIDACPGDSGGPLVCDNQMTGLVSFGFKCGLPEYPGIYTDAFYYYDWILKNSAYSGSKISGMLIFIFLIRLIYFY